MVVHGENAHGKSSLVDAFECFLFEKIEHLAKENVGAVAYKHRACPEASVRVVFSEDGVGGTLKIDRDHRIEFTPDTPAAELFRQEAGRERLILRYKDLSHFVDQTKSEKLKYLAPLLGTEVIDNIRTEFRGAVGQLDRDLNEHRSTIDGVRRSIRETTGKPDGEVWDTVRNQATRLTHETVGDLASLKALLANVDLAADRSRAEAFRQLADLAAALEDFRRQASSIALLEGVIQAFNRIAAEQRTLQDLQLSDLRKMGLDVLAASWWDGNQCPLCDEPLRDRDDLISHLEGKLEAAYETRTRAEEFEDLRSSGLTALGSLATDVRKLQESTGRAAGRCPEVETLCAELLEVLPRVDESLRVPLAPGTQMDGSEVRALQAGLDILKAKVLTAIAEVGNSLEELKPGDEERKRLDAYNLLARIANEIERRERLDQELAIIEEQVKSMRFVLGEFESLERITVSRLVDEISDDITTYYEKLYGVDRFSQVRLEFLPDDRGLEFKLVAYGEETSPPRRILSESFLNGLGLCLFLAAARKFNTSARFIILDDIVNSFDAQHRVRLADLLVEELSDFQLIVFTHDYIWYEVLRQKTRQTWKARRIVGWSYESGLKLDMALPEDRQRLIQYAEAGEVDVAGPLAGQYIEFELKLLCRKLEVPLPFKDWYENERRTIGELKKFLKRRVNDMHQFPHRNAAVWDDLNVSAFFRDQATHDATELASPLTGRDILHAVEKIDELVDLFKCHAEGCGKWVWYARSTTPEGFQCRCGGLAFR